MIRVYFKLIEVSRKWHRAKLCRYHFNRLVQMYGCNPLLYQLVDMHIKASEMGSRALQDMILFGLDRYKVKPDSPNYYFIKLKHPLKRPKHKV